MQTINRQGEKTIMNEYLIQGSTLTGLVNPVKKYEAEFVDNIDDILPIHPTYIESVDDDSQHKYTADELKTTWIIHHDVLPDNTGKLRLVLYKEKVASDSSDPPQEYDTWEPLFYEGSEIIEDVIYDKWREIETGPGDDVTYTWDSAGKLYVYTRQLTKPLTLSDLPHKLKVIDDIVPNVTFDKQGGTFIAEVAHDSGYTPGGSSSVSYELGVELNSGKTITPTTSKQLVATEGKYLDGDIYIGAIPSEYVKPSSTISSATTITPGTTDKTYSAGTYLKSSLTIKGDADLISSNIRQGADLFGVSGTFKYNEPITVSTTLSGVNIEGPGSIYPINNSTQYVRAFYLSFDISAGNMRYLRVLLGSNQLVELESRDLPAYVCKTGNYAIIYKNTGVVHKTNLAKRTNVGIQLVSTSGQVNVAVNGIGIE